MIAPLRYVISIRKRSKITILAIAIVIMFITSTYTIAYSFEVSNRELVERFHSQYYIISSSKNLLNSRVTPKGAIGAYVYLIPARIGNLSTYVVGIYDPHNVLGWVYECNAGSIILGEYFHKSGDVSVAIKDETLKLKVLRTMRFEFFPDYWGVINYTVAREFQKEPNFIITDKYLEVDGLITQSMIKLGDFYYKSSEETYVDLVLLSLISVVAIYFFINALLEMEISENIRKIAIIRALGSTSHNISAIYFLRSLYIGAAGMIMGLSFGIVLSYMLPTILQFSGLLSYLSISIPFTMFLINLLLTVVGATLASIHPIRRAVGIEILEGMRRGAL